MSLFSKRSSAAEPGDEPFILTLVPNETELTELADTPISLRGYDVYEEDPDDEDTEPEDLGNRLETGDFSFFASTVCVAKVAGVTFGNGLNGTECTGLLK